MGKKKKIIKTHNKKLSVQISKRNTRKEEKTELKRPMQHKKKVENKNALT